LIRLPGSEGLKVSSAVLIYRCSRKPPSLVCDSDETRNRQIRVFNLLHVSGIVSASCRNRVISEPRLKARDLIINNQSIPVQLMRLTPCRSSGTRNRFLLFTPVDRLLRDPPTGEPPIDSRQSGKLFLVVDRYIK
jgi:hypothetical protein